MKLQDRLPDHARDLKYQGRKIIDRSIQACLILVILKTRGKEACVIIRTRLNVNDDTPVSSRHVSNTLLPLSIDSLLSLYRITGTLLFQAKYKGSAKLEQAFMTKEEMAKQPLSNFDYYPQGLVESIQGTERDDRDKLKTCTSIYTEISFNQSSRNDIKNLINEDHARDVLDVLTIFYDENGLQTYLLRKNISKPLRYIPAIMLTDFDDGMEDVRANIQLKLQREIVDVDALSYDTEPSTRTSRHGRASSGGSIQKNTGTSSDSGSSDEDSTNSSSSKDEPPPDPEVDDEDSRADDFSDEARGPKLDEDDSIQSNPDEDQEDIDSTQSNSTEGSDEEDLDFEDNQDGVCDDDDGCESKKKSTHTHAPAASHVRREKTTTSPMKKRKSDTKKGSSSLKRVKAGGSDPTQLKVGDRVYEMNNNAEMGTIVFLFKRREGKSAMVEFDTPTWGTTAILTNRLRQPSNLRLRPLKTTKASALALPKSDKSQKPNAHSKANKKKKVPTSQNSDSSSNSSSSSDEQTLAQRGTKTSKKKKAATPKPNQHPPPPTLESDNEPANAKKKKKERKRPSLRKQANRHMSGEACAVPEDQAPPHKVRFRHQNTADKEAANQAHQNQHKTEHKERKKKKSEKKSPKSPAATVNTKSTQSISSSVDLGHNSSDKQTSVDTHANNIKDLPGKNSILESANITLSSNPGEVAPPPQTSPMPPLFPKRQAMQKAPLGPEPDFDTANENHISNATPENSPCLISGFPNHKQMSNQNLNQGRAQMIRRLLAHAHVYHQNIRNLDTNLHREDFNSIRTLTYDPCALKWYIQRMLTAKQVYISASDPSNPENQWGTTPGMSVPQVYTLTVRQTGYKWDNVYCFDVLIKKLMREARAHNHILLFLPPAESEDVVPCSDLKAIDNRQLDYIGDTYDRGLNDGFSFNIRVESTMDLLQLRSPSCSYMGDARKRIDKSISCYNMTYSVTSRRRITDVTAAILTKADEFALAPTKEELRLAMLAKNSNAFTEFNIRFSSHVDRGTTEDKDHIITHTMCLTAQADKTDIISAHCENLDLATPELLAPTTRKMTIVPVRNLTPSQRARKRAAMRKQNEYLSSRKLIFFQLPDA